MQEAGQPTHASKTARRFSIAPCRNSRRRFALCCKRRPKCRPAAVRLCLPYAVHGPHCPATISRNGWTRAAAMRATSPPTWPKWPASTAGSAACRPDPPPLSEAAGRHRPGHHPRPGHRLGRYPRPHCGVGRGPRPGSARCGHRLGRPQPGRRADPGAHQSAPGRRTSRPSGPAAWTSSSHGSSSTTLLPTPRPACCGPPPGWRAGRHHDRPRARPAARAGLPPGPANLCPPPAHPPRWRASVRRAYTPRELRALAQAAGLAPARVTAHWPWRMTLVYDCAAHV